MDALEKYFEKKRRRFDDEEPEEGHFARFEAKLNSEFGAGINSQPRIFMLNRPMVFRIAAGLVILCTLSFFMYDFVKTRMVARSAGIAVNTEIEDAINYYNDAAAAKMGTLRTLACCGKEKEEIYNLASGQMKNLDQNTAELKTALKTNPGDERIQAAIILNQQMKVKVVDDMISQMNKFRK